MNRARRWNWIRTRSAEAVAVLAALPVLAGPVQAEGACEVPVEWIVARPDPQGQPTEVQIGVYLIDLRSIDDSAQSFDADIFLSVTWKDPRLVSSSQGESRAGCIMPLDDVWNPRIIFVNERTVDRLFDEKVSVAPDGTVEYLQRLQGQFTSKLHLRDFPFDNHELFLDIVSRGYFPEQVSFTAESGGGNIAELTISDWEVGEGYSEVAPRYIAPRDWYIAAISFRVPVKRRMGFYTLKTFLPLTLIVFMSWGVFWIHPEMLPSQIGISTSAILTLIAFQFSLGYMLPRLSYLTRADRFLIGSTLLVFLAFGEALWTSYLARHDQERRALGVDRVSRILFPLGFAGVLVISFLF